METDVDQLEKAVVTGYGTFKKSTYTGSASVVNTEKLRELPVVSLTQMMEGNLPGVQMFSSSGQPGSGTSTIVRGRGSINASTEPLFVLDGVPVGSGNLSEDSNNAGGLGILSTLNPSDIESITVLKDAASASLYGARGANGVILIKTKSVQKGKTVYNVKVNGGFSDFAVPYRPMMGGQERRELIYEGYVNYQLDRGMSLAEAQQWADTQIDDSAPIPSGGYADWESAMFHKGWQQNYDFSAMGGSDQTRFTASVNYTKQDGMSFDSYLKRYSGRFGIDNTHGKLDFGVNILLSYTQNKATPEDSYYSSPLYATRYSITPSNPIYLPEGTYNHNFSQNGNYNPIEENEFNKFATQASRAFTSAHIGYTFIPGLKLQTTFNADMAYTKEFRFWSPQSGDGRSTNGNAYQAIYQRFNFKTRRGYQCFSMNAPITAPMKHFDDAGGDTDSGFVHFFKDYAPEDPDACIPWELVEFGIVTTGDDEQRGTVMQRFHNLGWPASKLAQYYVGDELACGVKCWKFDTRKKPVSGSVGAIYWIDPSNGLCLKQQASDGSGFEVFIYDLQYQEWTIDLYPEAFLDK